MFAMFSLSERREFAESNLGLRLGPLQESSFEGALGCCAVLAEGTPFKGHHVYRVPSCWVVFYKGLLVRRVYEDPSLQD